MLPLPASVATVAFKCEKRQGKSGLDSLFSGPWCIVHCLVITVPRHHPIHAWQKAVIGFSAVQSLDTEPQHPKKCVGFPSQSCIGIYRLISCADLVHAASATQRLFETPIPVSYTRHTSRSLMLWLLSLPFALWNIMGPSMVPACLFISYVSPC